MSQKLRGKVIILELLRGKKQKVSKIEETKY